MKALNLIALSLGGALVLVLGVSMVAELLFGKDLAMFVIVPVALFTGLNARRVTEKFLGYTLLEALKENKDDTTGN